MVLSPYSGPQPAGLFEVGSSTDPKITDPLYKEMGRLKKDREWLRFERRWTAQFRGSVRCRDKRQTPVRVFGTEPLELLPIEGYPYPLRGLEKSASFLEPRPELFSLPSCGLEGCGRTALEVASVLEGEYWGEGEDTAGTERTESPDGSTGRNMSNPDVCTTLHRC